MTRATQDQDASLRDRDLLRLLVLDDGLELLVVDLLLPAREDRRGVVLRVVLARALPGLLAEGPFCGER